MVTTMSDLPVDLLTEILYRIPLKSLRTMRLTCKTWDTLSKSGIFRKMNMRKEAAREEGESRLVMVMDSTLHLISVVVADVEHPSIELRGKLSLYDSDQQVKINKVFHCNGVLLCVFKDSFDLVVWNPYLGQTRWIKPPSNFCRDGSRMDIYRYALGYDNEKKSHKILRISDDCIYERRLIEQLVYYEIYDFDSRLWRTLNVGSHQWYICVFENGVPLNGNTYWLAKHRNSALDGYDGLICFDFTRETFGPILPLSFPCWEGDGVLSTLKGEKLALLLQFGRPWDDCEIWVIDPNSMSWSKFLTMDRRPEIYISHAGFFIDEEKKVAMVFDKGDDTRHTLNIIGEAGFFRQVDVDPLIERTPLDAHDDHAHVCSYVPSLVQVQIKKRVFKREQPSKLDEEDSAKRTRPT